MGLSFLIGGRNVLSLPYLLSFRSKDTCSKNVMVFWRIFISW